jgi:hypothetical protein
LGIRSERRFARNVADLVLLFFTGGTGTDGSSSEGSILFLCNILLVGLRVDFGGTVGDIGSCSCCCCFVETGEMAKSVVFIVFVKGFLRRSVPTILGLIVPTEIDGLDDLNS